jgi:nucleotide-binding universal stress UspA family protein
MAGTIVVGVDGSAPSLAALRWAADEARLREARLVAVYAWTHPPPVAVPGPGLAPLPEPDLPGQVEALREAAAAELDDALSEAFSGEPPVEIERRLLEGRAGEVLERESASADLVVVGSRGRSALAAALLGSVSEHVVGHAACPVVVLKAQRES